MRWPSPTRGDVAIAVAVVLLIWALSTPALRARSFRALTEQAYADVETVVTAAQAARSSTARWPGPAEAGVMPTELVGRVPFESGFTRDGYTLEWSAFQVVDYVEVDVAPPAEPAPGDAPPPVPAVERRPVRRDVGALHLRSAEADLLAELLRRFGPERSFVLDSTWTLVVEADRTP